MGITDRGGVRGEQSILVPFAAGAADGIARLRRLMRLLALHRLRLLSRRLRLW
jgi:hypothetical protein